MTAPVVPGGGRWWPPPPPGSWFEAVGGREGRGTAMVGWWLVAGGEWKLGEIQRQSSTELHTAPGTHQRNFNNSSRGQRQGQPAAGGGGREGGEGGNCRVEGDCLLVFLSCVVISVVCRHPALRPARGGGRRREINNNKWFFLDAFSSLSKFFLLKSVGQTRDNLGNYKSWLGWSVWEIFLIVVICHHVIS